MGEKMIYGDSFKELKGNLAKGELEFLGNYEPSIRGLFKELAMIGAVKMATTKEQADRMVKYRYTLNSPAFLHRNVIRFTELSNDERKKVISFLKENGFEINELGNQMFSIIAHNYHNHLEDLKLHFELFIDFGMICDLLGEGIPRFKSFNWMVKIPISHP